MLSKMPSKPLGVAGSTSSKQKSHSTSGLKKNLEAGPSTCKRRCSVTNADDVLSKRLYEHSEFPSDSVDKPEQDKLDSSFHAKKCIPHHLTGLMYRLDLSVLYLLRKSIYENKYPSLSLAFKDSEIDRFSDIVLRYKQKSVHLRIEYEDKYYVVNGINYARLFTKKTQYSTINDYFSSFAKHLISKSDTSSEDVKYLIVFTNSGLDLTEKNEFKKGKFKNFYPFKFDRVNIKECNVLKDFLYTNDNMERRCFYQFSREKTTRKELLNRLEFSSTVEKMITEIKLPQEFKTEIKRAFLDELVFATNQPSREELNNIVKSVIQKNTDVQKDYIALQKKVLRDLTASKKPTKLGDHIIGITYEFTLLMSFLHAMFLHKNMFFVNLEGTRYATSNAITINYRGRITYVKAYTTNSSIDYSQLFPSKHQKKKNIFSINKHFRLFIEELEKDMRYFIIYTNVGLELTEEKELKKGRSKVFYPVKFNSIDIKKKKYKMLRNCAFINENGLYQFAQDETTKEKLSSLLIIPPSLQKEKNRGLFFNVNEQELKQKFLHKLIFAVNQPNMKGLKRLIKKNIEADSESDEVPYNYKELHEIALRWLESHVSGPITREIMEKLLRDIKNNWSSLTEVQDIDIEIFKFARCVTSCREGTPIFNQFLYFLIQGKGRE